MMREFVEDDLQKIELKDFGEGDLLSKMLPVIRMYEGTTLEEKGAVKAILFYRAYAEGHYEGFLVCAVGMTAFDGQKVKEFIYELKNGLGIKRIETLSIDSEELNRWHKFLGFVCEGTKKRFLKGKDYNMWALLSEA